MRASARVQEKAFERRWWILGVLCFSLIVIVLDNTILNVAIPRITDELHATNSQLQWMVDSYTLVFAGLLLTAGSLGDRFGRRGALQIGLTIFGLGSLASAAASTSGQLISTRAVMGIGGAFIMPATLSIITNVFPANERGRAIGVWAGTAGLGGAIGPLAGGFLLQHFYWGSIFLVNIPIVAFGLIAGVFLIPTSKDPSAPKLDPLGAVLSIAGLTSVLYGIIEAPAKGWGSPLIVTTFVVGAILLIGFTLWERRTDHPMLDVQFFKNPRFTAASSGIMLVFFAMFGSVFLLTQHLQFVMGFSPLQAGVRLLPFAGVMMIAAPLSSKLVERIGTKITVAAGLLIVAIALVSFAFVDVNTGYGTLVWMFVLIGLGMGLTMAPATDSIMGSLPLAKAGVGSAVNDTTRQVGGALGVAIIGSVLSSSYTSKVGDAITRARASGQQVPASAASAAKQSLGGALTVAGKVGGALGSEITTTAKQAFVSGMHSGVLVGAFAALVGSVVALVWLPARARRDDVTAQDLEYAEEAAADHVEGVPVATAEA